MRPSRFGVTPCFKAPSDLENPSHLQNHTEYFIVFPALTTQTTSSCYKQCLNAGGAQRAQAGTLVTMTITRMFHSCGLHIQQSPFLSRQPQPLLRSGCVLLGQDQPLLWPSERLTLSRPVGCVERISLRSSLPCMTCSFCLFPNEISS